MNYSLYLVGSKARGDQNSQSDTDYVCIYNVKRPRIELPEGASVSYYSVGKMKWMIENSKLFAKHLMSEGIPIIENKKHKQLINSFEIKKDILEKDLVEFIKATDRLDWIPASDTGIKWACDYIYTLSRNIIYISNALNDFFHFGYSEAVNKFLKNHNKIEYIAALQKIRLAKYNYRTNNPIQVDISVKSISDVIYAVTNKRNAISLGGISDFSNIKPNSYEHLRLTERAIINGEVSSEDYIKKLKRHSEYSCLLRDQARKITTNLKG